MYAEQASGEDDSGAARGEYELKHPQANKVEGIVRTAWSNARLVAD